MNWWVYKVRLLGLYFPQMVGLVGGGIAALPVLVGVRWKQR